MLPPLRLPLHPRLVISYFHLVFCGCRLRRFCAQGVYAYIPVLPLAAAL